MIDGVREVFIVSGAASGIGQALVLLLVRSDKVVYGIDVDKEGLQKTAEQVDNEALYRSISVDVTDELAWRETITNVAEERGRLDGLISCAGFGVWGDVRQFDEALWRRVFDVNFWAMVHGSMQAYEIMREQGFGNIINVASLAGLVSAPTVVPYAAAKHAIVGFTTSLRAEAMGSGLTISVVCPGPIATGFHESITKAKETKGSPNTPADSMTAHHAAQEIMRGMRRDTAVIVFPSRARWLWRFYRCYQCCLRQRIEEPWRISGRAGIVNGKVSKLAMTESVHRVSNSMGDNCQAQNRSIKRFSLPWFYSTLNVLSDHRR